MRMGVQGRGVVSQTFLVPPDARALRFNVCGGTDARVGLYDAETRVYTVSATNNDAAKIPVSWNLVEFRGKMLRIAIEDATASVPYGYIGATGFDVITSYNGP
jgi:hypothetical protein